MPRSSALFRLIIALPMLRRPIRPFPMLRRLALLAALLVAAVGWPATARVERHPVVDILQLEGPFDPPSLQTVTELVDRANRTGSELVVLQIDAGHGLSVSARRVVDTVRGSDVPVAVWVGPGRARAGGAAAFLVLASHLPAMASQARLLPLCPVVADRPCTRNELALARRVAPSAAVERLLSQPLPGTELERLGAVTLTVESLESLLVELDGREVLTATGPTRLELREDEITVRFHSRGLLRRLLHAVLDPTAVYLLLVTVLLLLAFEVFQPGFGVAGVAALVLAPLAVYGLSVLPVRGWALALVVVGLVFLAVDLAVAALGVATAAGTAALAVGSWWLFAGDPSRMRLSAWVVSVVVAASVVFFVVVMTVVLRAQAGPAQEAVGDDLVGSVGVVRSTLNPEGHVFVAGALWRARFTGPTGGRVRTGTRVRVHGRDGAVLLVEAADQPSSRQASEARAG